MAGKKRQEWEFCPLVGCAVAESDIADRVRLNVGGKTSPAIEGPESLVNLSHQRLQRLNPPGSVAYGAEFMPLQPGLQKRLLMGADIDAPIDLLER